MKERKESMRWMRRFWRGSSKWGRRHGRRQSRERRTLTLMEIGIRETVMRDYPRYDPDLVNQIYSVT